MNFKANSLWVHNPRQLTKEATTKVSTDTNTWEAEILKMLQEEHPYVPTGDLVINFNKKDEDTGTATGRIIIKTNLSIPIIIKNREVSPLDIIQYNDEFWPLTSDTVRAFTSSHVLGKSEKNKYPRQNSGGLQSATRVPVLGKYAMAAMCNPTEASVEKVLNDSFKNEELAYLVTDEAVALGINKYVEIAKQASTYVPTTALGEDKVGLIAISKVTVDSEPTVGYVNTKSGLLRGIAITKQANVRTGQIDKVAFISDNGTYSEADHIYVGASDSDKELKLVRTKPSGRGVFIKTAGDVVACTEPLTVKAAIGRDTYLIDLSGYGHNLNMVVSPELEGMSKIGNTLYVGPDWSFVPVNKEEDIIPFSNISPELNKIAGYDFTVKYEDTVPVGFEVVLEKTASESPIFSNPLSDNEKSALLSALLYVRADLCKEAKVSSEQQDSTVDTILGLNFLTQQKIDTIIGYIPMFESSRAALAKLLMAGRLGAPLDNSTIKHAMLAIDKVIKGLKQYKIGQLVE